MMSVGIRADSILLSRARIPLYTAVGVATVLIAAGLGWLLAGPAIRPLRRLTAQTMRLGKGTDTMEAVTGAREAEELSDAMAGMLDRLAAAQQATTNSLQAAQDFAANAAHELRTPLTAMRADLDTSADPRPARRGTRGGGRRPAACSASRRGDHHRAGSAGVGAARAGRGPRTDRRDGHARPGGAGERPRRRGGRDRRGGRRHRRRSGDGPAGCGWPWTTWCATPSRTAPPLESRWRRSRTGDVLTIVVDDNGGGLPVDEHQVVLGRFARGSTAAPGGSGLGLALVAQQAALHGGSIELSDGPLGGLRATLTVTSSPEPEEDPDDDETVSAEPGPMRRRATRVAGWRSLAKRPPRS